jgi:hypothetical protein
MIMDSSPKQLLAYSLIVMLLTLPSLALAQAQTSGEPGQAAQQRPSGDDAVYCRPPQDLIDSRVKGPKVCMTVGQWKELRAKGLDVSADGQNTVPLYNGGLTGTP